MAARKKIFGTGGSVFAGSLNSAYFTYYNNMLLMTNWAAIEPSPGMFKFGPLDADIVQLADAGINIFVGVQVQPRPLSPAWLSGSGYNVPIVSIQGSPDTYAYYFDNNGVFKQRFFKMLDKLSTHCLQFSNVVAIQSFEGYRALPQAYLGVPVKTVYIISDSKFLNYQKDAWEHEYNYNTTTDNNGDVTQTIAIITNAENNSDNTDYILNTIPYAWIKALDEGNDYGYNLELFDWDKIGDQLTAKRNNTGAFRKRCLLSSAPTKSWFTQAYNKNMLQIALHMLTKGNDIWTIGDNSLIKDGSFSVIHDLVNELSANDNPSSKEAVAWWAANGKIDGADLTRFPANIYGKVLNDGTNSSTNPNDYVTKANITRLNAIRTAMGGNCTLISAQFGKGADPDKTKDDKYLGDIGMKVRQTPLGRWMTQPNYLTESKFYWRLGTAQEYWGRYGVGFIDADTKLYYKLDADFKIGMNAVTVTIVYWNEGNTQWRLRNVAGTNALTKTNTNTKAVKTVSVDIDNFQSAQLPNGNDFVLEFISGLVTGVKFFFIKENKRTVIIANQPPIVNAGTNDQITGTSKSVTGTASDPDGTIASTLWDWDTDNNGDPIYPVGSTPVIATPTNVTSNITGITVDGVYGLDFSATDNLGATSHDKKTIEKVPALTGPIAQAGADKSNTLPDTTVADIGATDVPGSFPIETIQWAATSVKPNNATDPTFGTPTAAHTAVANLTKSGTYEIGKTVDDGHGNTNTDYMRITVFPATSQLLQWGVVSFGTELNTDQKIAFAVNMNVDIIRNETSLERYTNPQNEGFMQKIANEGHMANMTVNWDGAGNTGQAREFVHGDNLTLFLNRLDALCAYYKNNIAFVTIENEPDNSQHYVQDATNTGYYIEEVRQAIIVCHKYGLKVSDGCLHTNSAVSNSGRAAAIKAAYTNEWADLDYINLHTYYPRDSTTAITNAVNAMKNAKGPNQKIITNECGLKNPADENGINPDEVNGLVSALKSNGLVYAVLTAAGAGGTAKPFNIVGTTTRNANGDRFISIT